MLRAHPLIDPAGVAAALEAVVSDIVEELEQEDGDGRLADPEPERPPAQQGHARKDQELDQEIDDQPVAEARNGPPTTTQALGLERPGLTNLADDGTDKEVVDALAEPGRGGVLEGRAPHVVTMEVGNAEVHVA